VPRAVPERRTERRGWVRWNMLTHCRLEVRGPTREATPNSRACATLSLRTASPNRSGPNESHLVDWHTDVAERFRGSLSFKDGDRGEAARGSGFGSPLDCGLSPRALLSTSRSESVSSWHAARAERRGKQEQFCVRQDIRISRPKPRATLESRSSAAQNWCSACPKRLYDIGRTHYTDATVCVYDVC
jgi:hypothetical protein